MKKEKTSISKDMNINELVTKHPECINVLQENGIRCVGCHSSKYETLEQGLKVHGLDAKKINSVLKDIKKSIDDADKDKGKDFIVTEKAAEMLKKVIKESKKENFGLRIGVFPGGCSGLQYSLELDDKTFDTDSILHEKGIKIIISKSNLQFLKGARLDYSSGPGAEGFRLFNPNESDSCGCG